MAGTELIRLIGLILLTVPAGDNVALSQRRNGRKKFVISWLFRGSVHLNLGDVVLAHLACTGRVELGHADEGSDASRNAV